MGGFDGAARDKAENRKKTPFFHLQKDFPGSDWIMFPFVYNCGHESTIAMWFRPASASFEAKRRPSIPWEQKHLLCARRASR